MTTDPQSLIRILTRIGVTLTATETHIILRAATPPPAEVIQVVRTHKPALMQTLRTR